MNAIGTVLIVVVLPQMIVTCKYDRHNWIIITCRIRSSLKYVIYRRYKVYHFETINCPVRCNNTFDYRYHPRFTVHSKYHFSNNSLTGTIPSLRVSSTTVPPYLESFELDTNFMLGTVPDWFMSLHSNILSGTIPSSIGSNNNSTFAIFLFTQQSIVR